LIVGAESHGYGERVTPGKFQITSAGLRADLRSIRPGSAVAADRTARFYSEHLPRVARGVLIDVGCGTSPLRGVYEPLVDRAWGLDWPGTPHGRVPEVYCDLSGGVPVREGCVDVVLASDVVEHLPDPGAFFVECSRVLADGGVLIGNMPFMYRLHEEPFDFQRLTEHGLRRALERAGFEATAIEVVGGGADTWMDLTAKLLARLPRIGRYVARAVERAFLRLFHAPTDGSGSETARLFPLAYGFVAARPNRH
jgi:SAM-dependent methyltransferase